MKLRIESMSTVVVFIILCFFSCNSGKHEGDSQNKDSAAVIDTPVTKTSVEIEHLTKETFQKQVFKYKTNKEWKYEGDMPCIVDFYAVWCGPCKKLAPILQSLANEYEGKIKIYKVNVDQEKELAAAFGVSSIPTLLFCPKKGNPQITQGLTSKENLVMTINGFLLKENPKDTTK